MEATSRDATETEDILWTPGKGGILLPDKIIHLWRVNIARYQGATQYLDAQERARLQRFRFAADARRFTVGRAALRLLLGSYLGQGWKEVRIGIGEHGKPMLPDGDIQFNLSHSGDWVLLAFVRQHRIGVDVEQWRSLDIEALGFDVFTPEEIEVWNGWPVGDRLRRFFDLWTLKESYLKGLGAGLSKPPHTFGVRHGPDRQPCLAWDGDESEDRKRWRLRCIPWEAGYSAAFAWDGDVGAIERFGLDEFPGEFASLPR